MGRDRKEGHPKVVGRQAFKMSFWAFNQNWHKQWVSWGYSNTNIHSDKTNPQKSSVSKLEQTTNLKRIAKRPAGQEPKSVQVSGEFTFHSEEREEERRATCR